MNKPKVTKELIQSYLEGQTNYKETAAIIAACNEDKRLRSFLDQTVKIREYLALKNNCAEINLSVSKLFPLVAMAAECDSDNLCSIKCELNILERFGKAEGMTENTLSEEARNLGILKDEGTPLFNIGRILSLHGLSVMKQVGATIQDLIKARTIQKCEVMVPVMGEKTFHAIVIQNIEEDSGVSFYNPATDSIGYMNTDEFSKAWEVSRRYMVKVATREAARNTDNGIYHPSIDVPELTGKLKELEWALAEGFHDLWASGRLKEGYRYGEISNAAEKVNSDLRPLADLGPDETNYDVRNARYAVYMLTEVFGFDLVNFEEKERYCIESLRQMGYKIEKQ